MPNLIHTNLRLLFTTAGQDVSQSVLPDLLSFTFSDKETGEADELRLTLKDEMGKWAATWKPEGGEVVDAYLSTGSGTDELHCGRFYVDSMSVSGSPRTFEMQAVSTPLNQPLRRKAVTKAWESRTLRGIAEEIASGNGLQLFSMSKRIRNTTGEIKRKRATLHSYRDSVKTKAFRSRSRIKRS